MLFKPGYKKFWAAPAVHGKAAAAGYTGAGDIVSGALGWWGLRGYNAAYNTGSNPAIDIVDQAGANSLTVNITSAGDLDTASISTWVTAHTVTTIRVSKLYDQSGNSKHMVQGTLGAMPELTLNAIGSRPAVKFTASRSDGLDTFSTNFTQSVPFTLNAVSKRTSTGTTVYFGASGAQPASLIGDGTASKAYLFTSGGFTAGVTASDSAFHSLLGMFNGASSVIGVDGSNTAQSASADNLSTTILGVSNSSFPYNGSGVEWGLWAADKSSNSSALSSNQQTYWGY